MLALDVCKCKVSGHVLGVGFSTGLGDSSSIVALVHEHVLAFQLWLGMEGVKGSPEAWSSRGSLVALVLLLVAVVVVED